ncbi:MAG: hypothetical protein KBF89_00705 [Acidimicrobiia bacterium]|jgi:hypothetical protein|nr:hypothetical protein [Acidimicrobiia bacterium]
MNYKEHALIIYPQAGEAITAIRRPIRERITPRSYESDLAKEKRSRATTTIRRYIKANWMPLLVTNTFEVDVSFEEGIKMSNYWIRKLRKHVFIDSFPYVKVLEGIPDDERLHIHAVLPLAPYYQIASTWNKGFVDIHRFPRTSSEFISKYLTKTFSDNLMQGKRGFTTGIGFKPIRQIMEVDNQDPVSILKCDLGLNNIVCIQDDYGFVGGGRFEFEPRIR